MVEKKITWFREIERKQTVNKIPETVICLLLGKDG